MKKINVSLKCKMVVKRFFVRHPKLHKKLYFVYKILTDFDGREHPISKDKEGKIYYIIRPLKPKIEENNHNEKTIIKNTCYVFDFAPDRALRQIAEYSARLNFGSKVTPEERVHEFISFLPVLCYDGSHMDIIDANELLDLVISGTASSTSSSP